MEISANDVKNMLHDYFLLIDTLMKHDIKIDKDKRLSNLIPISRLNEIIKLYARYKDEYWKEHDTTSEVEFLLR
jgi:putative IMPACT (imprinted ancient) family translation regulator